VGGGQEDNIEEVAAIPIRRREGVDWKVGKPFRWGGWKGGQNRDSTNFLKRRGKEEQEEKKDLQMGSSCRRFPGGNRSPSKKRV